MHRITIIVLLAVGLPLLSLAIAAEPATAPAASTRGWEAKQTWPAPEAHQAAAADEKHLYAIASEKIARYDRATGNRNATSTGEAKHLNSGFFWQGKLYCAHSNYPRLPEQSEIRVLDPESMQLTIFKDFGNFGGSLTWAVRRDDEQGWWCNFAHYGTTNDRTFLIHFDDEWKEQGRWTYPPDVIKQIGTASISGGLWRDGELLVTDHDHERLYRLQVPREGKVLTYLGSEQAPFTGQGIAADPVTGGLVGINRSKKVLILAIPAKDAKKR